MKKLITCLCLTAMLLFLMPVKAMAEDTLIDVCFTYTGTHDRMDTNNELYPYQMSDTASITAWKNDTVYLKAAISSAVDGEVHISASALLDEKGHEIKAEQIHVSHLCKTLAALGTGDVAWQPHVEIPEIICGETDFPMAAHSTEYFWIELHVPENTFPGTYQGTITVTADDIVKELTLQADVMDITLPEEKPFSLNLWQYPYSSLRYYDVLQNEEPFSEKHREILKKEMMEYAALGGSSITVTIIEEPWGHQTYDDTPSMIVWHKADEGYMWYDYSAFDAWVELCMECGITDRIDAFSILPWDSAVTLTLDNGAKVRYPLAVGSQEWIDVWTSFLSDYMYHLKEKGWFEIAGIFVDEREMWQVEQAVNVIQSVQDENGNSLRIAMAINNIPSDLEFFDRIDYVSISIGAVPEGSEVFAAFLEHRNAKQLETTLYNCSTTFPNAFAISDPDESVWFMEYLAAKGFTGYLRWALDSWTAEPLRNLDFHNFEAGDTLLIYPDEMDADDPQARSSVRLKMIDQGMRNVTKITYLLEQSPSTPVREALRNGYLNIRRSYGNYNTYGSMVAANPQASMLISEEVVNLDELIAMVSRELSEENRHKPFIKYACE